MSNLACLLIGHNDGEGVQDEPTEAEKQLMVAVMKAEGLKTIRWGGGKWTYTCKRCGHVRRS